MTMAGIYISNENESTSYPLSSHGFSPDIFYPEYPWNKDTISKESNHVYRMVRKCFETAGYDRNHFGTDAWNPLGEFITSGDTVLIKPNWVEHKNKNADVHDNLACMVTQPAVVRAVIDYVAIALNGSGTIVIGDAPMQGCDLQKMFEITGYDKLFSFYHGKIDLQVADLRKYSVSTKVNGVYSKPVMTENNAGCIRVNLGKHSMHAEKDMFEPEYKVSDYMQSQTREYHNAGKHDYEINRLALQADVIINVPKPKTHRLAGMTAAVKNFVGITYDKACLPHRIEKDKQHGGDAYLKKSIWKQWMHEFDEKRTYASQTGKYVSAKVNDVLMKMCYAVSVATSKDKYRIGSWYGNDTIWRTAVDLNYILLHADKTGKICDDVQRTILTIADMVICGQRQGPVAPTPKPLGMIMMAENCMLFDFVMCKIMGFNPDRLPVFGKEEVYKSFGYDSRVQLENETVKMSCYDEGLIECKVKDFRGKGEWRFVPHDGWKGHIEI